MNRNQFIASSTIVSGATFLKKPSYQSLVKSVNSIPYESLDNLTDSNGNFKLQSLPYPVDYLEPIIDAETLNLHYSFHHGGAVKAANKDLMMIKNQLEEEKFESIDFWTKKLAYHLSSHVLHSIFWTNLTRDKSTPKSILLRRAERDFDGFDKMKMLLMKAAKDVDGNGWGVLGYQPYLDKLTILQCEDHEKLTQWGIIPVLVIDAWEHAYYLKYKNRREEYIDHIFEIINWENVSDRLNIALKLTR